MRKKGLTYKEIAARCGVCFATAAKYSAGIQVPPFSRGYSIDGRSKDYNQYQIKWKGKKDEIVDSLLFEFHDSFGLSEFNENDIENFVSVLRDRGRGEREISYFLQELEKNKRMMQGLTK